MTEPTSDRDDKQLTETTPVPVDPMKLLERVDSAIMMYDGDFRIIFANDRAGRLYGWQSADLLGQVVHEIVPTHYPNSTRWVGQDLRTAGHWSGELVRQRRDGSTLIVQSWQTAYHENGHLVGVIEGNTDPVARDADDDRTRASGELIRFLLDGATSYAIFLLDPDGRIITWSTSAQRLTGYAEADILGQHYGILFAAAAVAAGEPDRILAQCALGRQEAEGERVREDGTRFWVVGTIAPVYHDDGALRGFVEITRDGTKRRRAEVRFRGLLESAPDAMIGGDADGRIVFANTQAELLFGYSQDELLGRQVEMLLPARVHAAHIAHRGRFVKEPTTRPMGVGLQLVAIRKDRSEFPVDVSLSALESDEGLIVLATIRDISERKRTQQAIEDLNLALRRANDELEQRVAARTASLAAQAAQLQAMNAELDAFSYSVSHDLRGPLRAVDGFASLLAVNYADVLDDAGQRYVARVRAGAQHMGQLIDGLLSFSQLQRQPLTRRAVDMTALFHAIWDELDAERAGRDVELTIGDLPRAHADAKLLRHVLTNLLWNALKFTRVRHPARISVTAETGDLGSVVYVVRDNGVGFDMKYVGKLFTVFQRLHRVEEYEGTGIGLALAARIVQRHGGTIWADGCVDGGAGFHFTLPRDQPEDRDVDAGGMGHVGHDHA